MRKFENRPNTAVLVVDMQIGVLVKACRRAAVVKSVESLVAKARREQVSVIWVQHGDKQFVRGVDRRRDGWRREASRSAVHMARNQARAQGSTRRVA